MMMSKLLFLVGFVVYLLAASCKKQNDWLDIPKDPNDNTLRTLADFQAVLDNSAIFNSNYPNIGQLACDNYFLTDQNFSLTPPVERNAYRWSQDIFEGRSSTDYFLGYKIIAHSNIVLDGLKEVEIAQNEQLEFNNIKGQALFFRAITYFELASIFCKPYSNQTASTDLGLSLKLTANIYEIEQRSSLEATYRQIIEDLTTASSLLPMVSKLKTRPSRVAAYALIARVCLNMGNYAKAKEFSDSVITNYSQLLNFNDGIPSLAVEYRFPDFRTGNKEVIFYSQGIGYTGIIPDYNFSLGFVDTTLFNSYEESDLRRKFFYEQQSVSRIKFRGGYSGTSFNFCGIGLNEVYLIRAESNARLDKIETSLSDVNMLLGNRYERGKYQNYQTDNKDSLLIKILAERRRELPFTSQIRWQDLRRLNADQRFAIYLTRNIEGEIITLAPNDPKYVYPIPQDEIERTGIAQNER